MTATETVEPEEKKSSKLPMIIGLVLALVGGGGGYFAANAGLLPFLGPKPAPETEAGSQDHTGETQLVPGESSIANAAFVPIEPLLISLGSNANARHLRFRGQVETDLAHAAEVEKMMPRIVDVLNSYLRAVEESDLREPSALVRLRAQMLRRIQIVTGPGRVKDLLIMEFVLN